jgi:hypothetical protein
LNDNALLDDAGMNPDSYSFEAQKNKFLDISQVMLERLKHGYLLDTPRHNMKLSNHFLHQNRKYSKRNVEAMLGIGIHAFWEWVVKLKELEESPTPEAVEKCLQGVKIELSSTDVTQINKEFQTPSGTLPCYSADWR